MRTNYIFWGLIILLLPAIVLGDCTCETDDGDTGAAGDKSLALKYKLSAFAAILVASAIGVCLPVIGKKFAAALSPVKNIFFIVKAFAAGVILSTGFIHVLHDAFESLTSPCVGDKPWADFPFTGFIAMVAAIGTLMVNTYATSYYRRKTVLKGGGNGGGEEEEATAVVVPVHTHATHGHTHGSFDLESGETEVLRHRVISHVLELGIIFHSIIIGIALGASQSPKTIRPLIAALTFHEFFEGLGLGGWMTQAKFNARTRTVAIIIVAFFSFTTPLGIGIGIGISNVYSETSATALIVQGVFNSASAGILIYMALVDFLSADFMSPRMQNNFKLRLGASASLLLGAGCMSVLAKWA